MYGSVHQASRWPERKRECSAEAVEAAKSSIEIPRYLFPHHHPLSMSSGHHNSRQ